MTATIIEGDCLEVMPQLPDRCIDLVLTDLPYGTTQNKWDCTIDLRSLWVQYKRLLSPRGAVILMGQGVFTAKLILSCPEWFKYKIAWVKSKATNFLNASRQPLRKHEDICVFYGRQPTYIPQMTNGEAYDKGVRKNQLTGSYGVFHPSHIHSSGARYPTDVIYFKTAESEAERTVWHPTQKPVALGEYLIETYTKPGDMVLDSCFGSGSFLVAAAKTGRQCLGIELNEQSYRFTRSKVDLIEVARSRLELEANCCAMVSRRQNLIQSEDETSLLNLYESYTCSQSSQRHQASFVSPHPK